MIGTILNGAGIILGGLAGLWVRRPMAPGTQGRLKLLLGVGTVYVGLSLSWGALHGGAWHALKGLGLALVSMMLGRLTGRWVGLQRGMSRIGQYAKGTLAVTPAAGLGRFNEGFMTATLLFCVSPLGLLGALTDGLAGDFRTLLVKALMDGLTTMAFVRSFGWGPLLSALPVLAVQGTLTLSARLPRGMMASHALVDPVLITAGLLVFAVALVILGIKKIELGDYLPSLLYAPLLAWLAR